MVLEQGVRLRDLRVDAGHYDVNALFNNIVIRAPLEHLSLPATGIKDSTLRVICQQLSNTLDTLQLANSRNLTYDGKLARNTIHLPYMASFFY
jgi:hypothetical protein